MRSRHLSCCALAIAIANVATACSQQDKKPRVREDAVVGTWASDTLTGADAASRRYELRITRGGRAELTSEVVGSTPVTERGTWDGADSLVRVVVRGERTASRATSILLAVRGDALGMVDFDTTAWGTQGLTLRRQAAVPDSTRR